MTNRVSGTVSRIVADRGFGFIASASGDVFFHHSSVVATTFDELQVGDAVEFTLTDNGKGPRGEAVERVDVR
jgi:cold shock CspA family protein